jgi:hypothetical protein
MTTLYLKMMKILTKLCMAMHFNVHVIYFVNKSLTPYSFRNPSFVCFSLITLCSSVTLYLVVTLSGRTLPYKVSSIFSSSSDTVLSSDFPGLFDGCNDMLTSSLLTVVLTSWNTTHIWNMA